MNTIADCFLTILHGDEVDSRRAARQVSKLLYSAKDTSKYEDIKQIVNTALNEYKKIVEPWRQENFVLAASVIYYLHDREAEQDFLFPWFYELLQHNNGVIRYAAVRMISHEFGPLTYYIRFPDRTQDRFDMLRVTKSQADGILYSLFAQLTGLLATLWKPAFKRYKYVDSLPTGPYKSIQMVFTRLEELCGREYMDRLTDRYHRAN